MQRISTVGICFYLTIQFYSGLTGSHSPCRALSVTPLFYPVHFPPNVGLRNFTGAQTSRLSFSLFTRCLAHIIHIPSISVIKKRSHPADEAQNTCRQWTKKINIKPLNHWKGLSCHNFFLWQTKGERSRNGKKEHPQTQRVEGLHTPNNRVALEGLPSPHPVLQSLRIPTKWSVLDVFTQITIFSRRSQHCNNKSYAGITERPSEKLRRVKESDRHR